MQAMHLVAFTLWLLAAPEAEEPWRCIGKYVPPHGYRQEVAFVPTKGRSNPIEDATNEARRKLLAPLRCRLSRPRSSDHSLEVRPGW